uniref:Ubiquitin-like protein ATG12 n=1 Tax=Noctiluca scintillans TaxID=2966 RepID=A0A7S1F089_NOCSC|mmetsp:Transcript_2380/g.6881  ORF Transcript_2380/g.6881 Transcript_2380/m.6881 type:complete len:120 (+) Transcript_2380:54-413(+)
MGDVVADDAVADAEPVEEIQHSGAIAARLAELRAGKVEIHLKAIGSTPTLRKPRFTIDGSKSFGELTRFIRGALKVESLHVYCCDAFEPSPDERIADLRHCFGVGPKLNISYSSEPAFS